MSACEGTRHMRPWRNWQTRTFEGRVGDRAGSSPAGRTMKEGTVADAAVLFYNGSVSLLQWNEVCEWPQKDAAAQDPAGTEQDIHENLLQAQSPQRDPQEEGHPLPDGRRIEEDRRSSD